MCKQQEFNGTISGDEISELLQNVCAGSSRESIFSRAAMAFSHLLCRILSWQQAQTLNFLQGLADIYEFCGSGLLRCHADDAVDR